MKEKGGWFNKFVGGVACALPIQAFCPTDRLCEPTNPSVDTGKLPKSDKKLPREGTFLSGHSLPKSRRFLEPRVSGKGQNICVGGGPICFTR